MPGTTLTKQLAQNLRKRKSKWKHKRTRLQQSVVVPPLFGRVVSTIRTVPHYIPFCVYHLPKRHMVCDHFESFVGLLCITVRDILSHNTKISLGGSRYLESLPRVTLREGHVGLFACPGSSFRKNEVTGSKVYGQAYRCSFVACPVGIMRCRTSARRIPGVKTLCAVWTQRVAYKSHQASRLKDK